MACVLRLVRRVVNQAGRRRGEEAPARLGHNLLAATLLQSGDAEAAGPMLVALSKDQSASLEIREMARAALKQIK